MSFNCLPSPNLFCLKKIKLPTEKSIILTVSLIPLYKLEDKASVILFDFPKITKLVNVAIILKQIFFPAF